jgi:putative ABC transport system substrate-binding protein
MVLALLTAPVGSEAQQTGKVYRIGYLSAGSADPYSVTFEQGLRDLGWVEGANLIIERRWAEGRNDRLPALARELAPIGE